MQKIGEKFIDFDVLKMYNIKAYVYRGGLYAALAKQVANFN